jgi:chorismate-pyruvate lyase
MSESQIETANEREELIVMPIAYPLDDFYARARRPLPPIQQVRRLEVPEPYRRLLCHEHDMTPTLESFHAATIHLKVLKSEQRDEAYYREVLLLLDQTNRPVEFGAIKINLHLFTHNARKAILDEGLPLGHVMADFRIRHTSRPKAFFKVQCDDFIASTLGAAPGDWLFGRRNTLYDPHLSPLAEIVEILPKLNPQ